MSKAIIAIDKSRSYRVYLAITTDMAEHARTIHQTTSLATAGLGRVLTAAGLMGIMLKNPQDKLTIQFKGDGPAQQILATANGQGQVKGYIANPGVDLPLTKEGKLDVGGSLGIGDLRVIKDLGMKEPYIGTIALVNGEIAEDLTAYFYISEQQNTSVALGVRIERDHTVDAAGGMIIQMLPDAEEGAIDALETMISGMPPLTTLIQQVNQNSAGKTEEGMVKALLEEIFQSVPQGYQPEALETRDIEWCCDCNRQRLETALMSIGEKDLKQIIEEDGQAELQCQFCLKKYNFNREDLENMLEVITK